MGLAPAPHQTGAAAANEAEARKQRVLARIAALESAPPPPMEPVRSPFGSRPPPNELPQLGSVAPPPGHAAPIDEETYIGMAAPLEEETYFGPAAEPPKRTISGDRTEIYRGAITPRAGSSSAYASSSTSPTSEPTIAVPPGYNLNNPNHRVADAEVEEPAPNTARMRQAAVQQTQKHPSYVPPPMQAQMPPQHPSQVPGTWGEAAPQQRHSQPPPQGQHHPPPHVSATTPANALAVRPWEPSANNNSSQRALGHQALHAISGTLDKRLVLLSEPHSTRAVSFRVLRDNLLTKSMPRVVAVTSATANDGKTTCAANLALALSELPHTRVLVVDANFFSFDLSKAFTVDRLGSISPPEAAAWLAPYKVVEVTAALHVAGIPPTAGQVRYEQHRFEAFIDHLLRVAYDFIVIDTPALRGTPSVTQMLANADGALLVVRSGGTTTRDLRKAAEALPPNKALGVALMDVLL